MGEGGGGGGGSLTPPPPPPPPVYTPPCCRYVSHAHDASCLALVRSLIEQHSNAPTPEYYWIDVCCDTGPYAPSAEAAADGGAGQDDIDDSEDPWATTVEKLGQVGQQIGDIGKLAVVLVPASAPMVCRRAWCFLELALASQEQIPVIGVTSPDHESDVAQLVKRGPASLVASHMLPLESSTATATNVEELVAIQQIVDSKLGGDAAMNQTFNDVLSRWAVAAVLRVEKGLGSGKSANSMQGGTPWSIADSPAAKAGRFAAQLGVSLYQAAEPGRAIMCLELAAQILEPVVGAQHDEIAIIFTNLGLAYESCGIYDLAIENFQTALQLFTAAQDADNIAKAYTNLGGACLKAGEPQRAITHFEAALGVLASMTEEDSADVANGYMNLGMALESSSDFALAVVRYTKAATIYDTLGDLVDNFEVTMASVQVNLGAAYFKLATKERHINFRQKAAAVDNAIDAYKRAKGLFTAVHSANHPETAQAEMNIGLIYDQKGEPRTAVRFLRSAVRSFQATLGHDHPRTLAAEENLARVQRRVAGLHDALSELN